MSSSRLRRWTAKEAAYKALYPTLRLRWSDLAVSKRNGKKPCLFFSSGGRYSGADDAVRLHLSVSHDEDFVVSFVVAERLAESDSCWFLSAFDSSQAVRNNVLTSLRSRSPLVFRTECFEIPFLVGSSPCRSTASNQVDNRPQFRPAGQPKSSSPSCSR